MAQTRSVNKSRSSAIPDIVRNTAVVIVSISIALASLSLALLSVTDSQSVTQSPNIAILRLALFSIGLLFIIASALVTDWLIDNFSNADWKNIFNYDDFDPNIFDQIPARFKLFGGGYFIFCLCISVISFCIVSQAPIRLAITNPLHIQTSQILAGIVLIYVLLQMMTREKVKGYLGLIVLGILIGLALQSFFISQ